jgi:predicted PurR-regulated permease PerM
MTQHTPPPKFLQWFPWEKVIIWGLFFLFIYTLKHFFFVIFMTFIVAYTMYGVVAWIIKRFFKGNPSWWLQTVVSIFCFLGLFGGIYGIGTYLVPEFVSQGQELFRKVSNPQVKPKDVFDRVLANSVGRWLFSQKFGSKNSPEYQAAFDNPERREKSHAALNSIIGSIEQEFEVSLFRSQVQNKLESIETQKPLFEAWIKNVKASTLLAEEKEEYASEWEKFYQQQAQEVSGLVPLASLDAAQRENAIKAYIANSLLANVDDRTELLREWETTKAREFAQVFQKKNPDEYKKKFQIFYNKRQKSLGDEFPYSFEEFSALRDALHSSPELLSSTLDALEAQKPDLSYHLFEFEERAKLLAEWKKGEIAHQLAKKLEEGVVSSMGAIGKEIGELAPKLFMLPFQFLLSLMLAFFIVIDVPNLAKGIDRLRHSHAREFYHEIAPGLINFGKLIGRAFQAQGVIAIANTLLTLAAIKLLGIQNAAFISAVVFLCSFIPVLGVVISGVPIALTALIQDGGGVTLALSGVGAILVVHFIETSALNPRILGNMLHLHPVLILAILAIGEHFFGVWGLLLGVPVMVYIIKFVILEEGLPGLIELPKRRKDRRVKS